MTRRIDRVHETARLEPALGWQRGPQLILDPAGRVEGTTEPVTAEQAVHLLLTAIEDARGSVRHGEAAADLIVSLSRLGFDVVKRDAE